MDDDAQNHMQSDTSTSCAKNPAIANINTLRIYQIPPFFIKPVIEAIG